MEKEGLNGVEDGKAEYRRDNWHQRPLKRSHATKCYGSFLKYMHMLKEFKWSHPEYGRREKTKPSPDTRGYKIKKVWSWYGLPLLKLSMQFHRPRPNMAGCCHCSWFPSRPRWQDYWCRPCTLGSWDMERPWLVLTWKLHRHWLALRVMRGSAHATRGEKSFTILPCNRTLQSYCKDWPGAFCFLAHSWRECYRSKRQLSDWV